MGGGSGAVTSSGGTAGGAPRGGSNAAGGSSAGGTTGGSGGSTRGGSGGTMTSVDAGSSGIDLAGAAGSAGANDCPPGANVTLVPSESGWIDHEDAGNAVGVQGGWYVYGDQYGPGETDARCIRVGLHQPSECAVVTSPPPPPAMGFPNIEGAMHTAGSVEKVLPCTADQTTSGCPDHDYLNMWGAGIGLDLNRASGVDGGGLSTWDPAEHCVLGISFTIDHVPEKGMRVEFPMLLTSAEAQADEPPITLPKPTTEEHSARSAYWGAQAKGDRMYPASPVTNGENRLYFSDVASPIQSAYTFDPSRIVSIRFHVIAGTASSYDFTISHLTFLRN
jgi:hypothetical protein